MATERYTTGQVIEALEAAHGIKARAAELLKCDRHTVDNYIKRHPTVERAYENLRETLVDRAERGLLVLINGNYWPAIRYTLSTLGRDRGFVKRQETDITSKGEKVQAAATVVILPDNDRGDGPPCDEAPNEGADG